MLKDSRYLSESTGERESLSAHPQVLACISSMCLIGEQADNEFVRKLLERARKLKLLRLDGCRLIDDTAFANTVIGAPIGELVMTDCAISDASLDAIARQLADTLTKLEISCSNITCQG